MQFFFHFSVFSLFSTTILALTISGTSDLLNPNLSTRSTSNITTSQPSNLSVVLPGCFDQFPDRSLRPALFSDCLEVLYATLRKPSAITPIAWDTRIQDYPLWSTYATCAVGVFPRYQTSRDIFPELLVSHYAAVIIEDCVRATVGKLGGKSFIGVRNEFEIAVYGRDPDAADGVGVIDTGEASVMATVR